MRRAVAAAVALFAILLLAVSGAAPAAACEEEGPGLVSVRLKAALAPEDAAKIVFEEFEGTLVIKGIALRGTASWFDGGAAVLEGPVNVIGVILTTGDSTTFLENRGILWLKYQFRDPAGTEVIGTGEGFVTLERVGDREGRGSFQGTVTLGGVAKQFAGTGESLVLGLTPAPAPAPTASAGVSCELTAGLFQEMDDTVLTGQKPGFEFEGAASTRALTVQYERAKRQLDRQRAARQRVIWMVR